MRARYAATLLSLALVLAACGHKSESVPASAPAALKAPQADKNTPAAPQRYIAVRHRLEVEVSQENLQGTLEATIRHCEQLGCEILSSGFTRESRYNQPSAELSVRLPPLALKDFLGGLEKNARMLQHQQSNEDKTGAVVDTEARLKNLTELRNRLRDMLASRPVNIKDVLEIEKELASTQAELDSIVNTRKALANETEKVAVDIRFVSARSIRQGGLLYPVVSAWDEAAPTFMSSLGGLITFIAAVLPWMVILVPVYLLLRRWWRKRKAQKAVS